MNRTIESIWCDDIRNEMGGKISLMGVYQSELIVPHEVTLQKICCYVMIKSPIDDKISSVNIRLMKNDSEQLARADISEIPDVSNDIPNARFYHIAAVMIISPLHINADTNCLRAVAEINGQEITGGGLNIRIQAPVQANTSQA